MAMQRNQLRIVGGEHRGRRLRFPDVAGLRPTAEKARETLFNWLQGELHGTRVLDLFAGSGALGFEALSRGAGEVVFVEKSREAARQLTENLALLRETHRGTVHQVDARRWLERKTAPFNIVFLDPPFAQNLLAGVCETLLEGRQLAPGAWIYLEQDAAHNWFPLPPGWEVYREGQGGQAAHRLIHSIG